MQQADSSSGIGGFVNKHLPGEPRIQSMGLQNSSEGLISLDAMRAIAWRQRFVLAGIVFAALLVGLLYTLLATPLYKAAATVRLELSNTQIVEGQDLIDPFIPYNQLTIHMQTQSDIVASNKMALLVVDDLGLHQDPDFVGDLAAGVDASEGEDEGASLHAARVAAANALQGNITVDLPLSSEIMSIEYTSADAALSARVANAYAENYATYDYEQSVEAAAYAREFLEAEIGDVRQRLNDAERRAIEYARANRIIGNPITDGGTEGAADSAGGSGTANTLTAANLMQANQTYTQARGARIVAEQRWRAVADVDAMQLPETQQSALVQQLRERRSEASARLAELRQRYRDDYPDVREAITQIETLDQQLATAANEIKRSIRQEYEIALRQERALQGELTQLSDASLNEQDRRVLYNQIDREVVSLRAQLGALMERYNQISAAANVRSSGVTLLDPAVVPRAPSSPNLLKNLLVALVLGVGIAGFAALVRELLDDRLRSLEDVEKKLRVPALGQTPNVDDVDLADLQAPFSPLSEAYASIRATLDYVIGASDKKVLQFTSSVAAEGKSTSCLATAIKFASVGRKVLLVDMDLRRPSIHKHCGVARPQIGVMDVLFSHMPLEKALLPNEFDNLDILPIAETPNNPVEILSSALVAEFLERAKAQYDVILIDSSPVMGIADAPLLSRFVDGVVFIVEANGIRSRESRAAIQRLHNVNANVIGAVVTKYRALEAGQSYHYQYNYYSYSGQG